MKTRITLFLLCAFALHAIGQQAAPTDVLSSKKGMIKVTILYPNGEGKTFNMDYYSNSHMPMVSSLLSDSIKGFEIDKGIAGGSPEESTPYLAIGYLYFDTVEAFQQSFGPNAEKIRGDIVNYTNIQPVVQISEVIK